MRPKSMETSGRGSNGKLDQCPGMFMPGILPPCSEPIARTS
jgi:hypothetical protein